MKMRQRARLFKRRPRTRREWTEYILMSLNSDATAIALKTDVVEPEEEVDPNAPLMQGRVGTFDGLKIVEGNYRGPLDQPTYLYPDVKEQTQ